MQTAATDAGEEVRSDAGDFSSPAKASVEVYYNELSNKFVRGGRATVKGGRWFRRGPLNPPQTLISLGP